MGLLWSKSATEFTSYIESLYLRRLRDYNSSRAQYTWYSGIAHHKERYTDSVSLIACPLTCCRILDIWACILSLSRAYSDREIVRYAVEFHNFGIFWWDRWSDMYGASAKQHGFIVGDDWRWLFRWRVTCIYAITNRRDHISSGHFNILLFDFFVLVAKIELYHHFIFTTLN